MDRKNSFRRKSAALLLGSLLACFVAEGLARLPLLLPAFTPSVPAQGKSVLCVGGMHAAGPGISATANYCGQLRALARSENRNDLHFIPLGRPGWDSGEILAALPTWLARYRPYKVLVQAGGENFRSCRARVGGPYAWRFLRGWMEESGWTATAPNRSYRDLKLLEKTLAGERMEADRAAAAAALQRIYEEGAGQGIRAAAAARMMARLATAVPSSHREQLAWLEKSYEAEPTVYNRGLLDDLSALRSRAGFPLALERGRRNLQARLDEARRATAMHADLNPIFRLEPGISPGWDSRNLATLEACYEKPECRIDIRRLIRSRPGDVALRRASVEISLRKGDLAFAGLLLGDWLEWNPAEGGEEPMAYADWLRRYLRAPRFAAAAEALDTALAAVFRSVPAASWRRHGCPSRERILSELEADLARMRELVKAAGAEVLFQTAPPRREFGWPRREEDFAVLPLGRAHPRELLDISAALRLAGRDDIFAGTYGSGRGGGYLGKVGHRQVAERIWEAILLP